MTTSSEEFYPGLFSLPENLALAVKRLQERAKKNDGMLLESVVLDTLKDTSYDESNKAKEYLHDNGVTIVPDDSELEQIDETPDDTDGIQPYDPSKIDITQQPQSLDNLLNRLEYDEIDLMPDFQRKAGLWNAGQQSRLIESLILRIPLPAFYFDGTMWDRWVIIDGLQRLTALKAFFVDRSLRLSESVRSCFLPRFIRIGITPIPPSKLEHQELRSFIIRFTHGINDVWLWVPIVFIFHFEHSASSFSTPCFAKYRSFFARDLACSCDKCIRLSTKTSSGIG